SHAVEGNRTGPGDGQGVAAPTGHGDRRGTGADQANVLDAVEGRAQTVGRGERGGGEGGSAVQRSDQRVTAGAGRNHSRSIPSLHRDGVVAVAGPVHDPLEARKNAGQGAVDAYLGRAGRHGRQGVRRVVVSDDNQVAADDARRRRGDGDGLFG